MNKVSAIIPMKGESVRLPNKNIKEFNGKPLCYWIIDSLVKVKRVNRIYIDTDSVAIRSLVNKYFTKINIINRPERLRGNNVSMNQIIDYDISQIKDDYILQTHATNPLLTPQTIDDAISMFFESMAENYDSLFSVTEWHKRLFDSHGNPINHDPQKLINTQDLDPIYEENSNIYIFSKTSFVNNSMNRIGKKPKLFPMPMLESIDIDYYDEFVLAEACAKFT